MSDLADAVRGVDFILLTPAYPKPWRSGGEFVRTRARAYVDAGLNVLVIESTLRSGLAPEVSRDGALPVWNIAAESLPGVLADVATTRAAVLAHSPAPTTIEALLDHIPPHRLAVWFHGYEVRDYRHLAGNNTAQELAPIRAARDQLNHARFSAARRLFAEDEATVVFMSNFQRDLAAQDIAAAPTKWRIIPNHIDEDMFRARIRRPDEATDLLLMRSFAERNYGNDIALRALGILAAKPGFERFNVTVRGFGRHFAEETAALHGLPNVRVEERYSSPVEMAAAHQRHGVYLCPTRFDTQGVMLGEAMASGMVSITNPVAAIPEYTDQRSSLLPRAEDPWAFADAIVHLTQHPELMPSMSAAAAERARQQCGRTPTIERELDLIQELTR